MEFLKPHQDPMQAREDRWKFELLLNMRTTFKDDAEFFGAGFIAHIDNARIVEALLDMGADVNTVLWSYMTILHHAMSYIHPETVGLLLKRGANANTPNSFGASPLDGAVRIAQQGVTVVYSDQQAIVRLLIKYGAVRHRGENRYDNSKLVSFYQAIRALLILCSPLVLSRLHKNTWLPVELIRELATYL